MWADRNTLHAYFKRLHYSGTESCAVHWFSIDLSAFTCAPLPFYQDPGIFLQTSTKWQQWSRLNMRGFILRSALIQSQTRCFQTVKKRMRNILWVLKKGQLNWIHICAGETYFFKNFGENCKFNWKDLAGLRMKNKPKPSLDPYYAPTELEFFHAKKQNKTPNHLEKSTLKHNNNI